MIVVQNDTHIYKVLKNWHMRLGSDFIFNTFRNDLFSVEWDVKS